MKKQMAYTYIYIGLLLLFGMGCSEVAEQEEESPHQAGWGTISDSINFHGWVVEADSFKVITCQSCHFQTESNTWDCWTCHAYFPHPSEVDTNQHQGIVRAANYRVWLCQQCHGSNYSGGKVPQVTCYSCHTNGPEACNTCHGRYNYDLTDTLSWSPPPDLLGRSDSSLVTVGAHASHLDPALVMPQRIGGPYSCSLCHEIPNANAVQAKTHPDTTFLIATVTLSGLAIPGGKNTADWNPATAACSNTYCHGNFEGGNTANIAVWTNVSGLERSCDKCHGYPPEEGHQPTYTQCGGCHFRVVAADDSTIIADSLHVDGEVQVY